MIENKTIIDKRGNIIEKCVSFNDNVPQFFKMKEEYKIVDVIDKKYIKPHWNGSTWEEGATDEEITASKDDGAEENANPTTKERIAILESAIDDLAVMISEIAGGIQ